MSSFGDAIQRGPNPIEEALRGTTMLHAEGYFGDVPRCECGILDCVAQSWSVNGSLRV